MHTAEQAASAAHPSIPCQPSECASKDDVRPVQSIGHDCTTLALCSCSSPHGIVCDKSGRLVSAENENRPLVECGPNCACPMSCANRFVQSHSQGAFSMEIFRLATTGWAVRTQVPIPAWSFVCEYAGLVVSQKTAKKCEQSRRDGDPNFLLVLREHRSNGAVLLTHVDASSHGNVSRFFNHSCEPNLVLRAVRVGSVIPRLAFFSIRDITLGEELTFSYGGEGDPEDTPFVPLPSNPDLKPIVRVECKCGSSKCRGILPYDPSVLRNC